MRVLHVAAECHPLVKTGGLADVVHAHDSHRWRSLMRRAMAQDFSWHEAACRTLSLYDALRGAPTEAGAARKSSAALT